MNLKFAWKVVILSCKNLMVAIWFSLQLDPTHLMLSQMQSRCGETSADIFSSRQKEDAGHVELVWIV